MHAKYWLVFKRGGERLTKPFATLEGLNNYIQGRRIEVIAKTKVIGKEYEKQIPKKVDKIHGTSFDYHYCPKGCKRIY